MNIQEREEREFHHTSQLEILRDYAYRTQYEQDQRVLRRIELAMGAGKFAAICAGPDYCQLTDAILGERQHLVGIFDTREEAEAVILANTYEQDECRYWVLPHQG